MSGRVKRKALPLGTTDRADAEHARAPIAAASPAAHAHHVGVPSLEGDGNQLPAVPYESSWRRHLRQAGILAELLQKLARLITPGAERLQHHRSKLRPLPLGQLSILLTLLL